MAKGKTCSIWSKIVSFTETKYTVVDYDDQLDLSMVGVNPLWYADLVCKFGVDISGNPRDGKRSKHTYMASSLTLV